MVLGLIFGIFYLLIDFVYWSKWLVSYIVLRLRKITHPRRFDLYDFDVENQPEKLGVLIPKKEIELESPFSEEHLAEAADEVFIYGVNSKSEVLVVRISRGCGELSEAWIYLKLADGRRFELEKTSGHQRNHGSKCTTFSCGGLQMHYLSPMRRWRIAYCGMLKESGTNEKEESHSVFVKFTFVWTASSDVYDFTSDLETSPTALALAGAKWNSFYPPIDKLSETFNFYSQSGVISGTVSVEEEDEIEMYLFGERTRHIGKSSYMIGCEFKQVTGYVPESGLLVRLGRASIPNIFHNLYFGYIVHPRGSLHAVEDGTLITNMTETSDSGINLTAKIKADKKYEFNGSFVGGGVHLRSDHGWKGFLELREVEFKVGELTGRGLVICGEINSLPRGNDRCVLPVFPINPMTVTFEEDEASLVEITGGKGSSLGKLTKLSKNLKSFVVPKGIVVTTAAFSCFLTPEIKNEIENLKNVIYGNIRSRTEECCKMVASAIRNEHLPDVITEEIERKLNTLCDGEMSRQKFAVRSSATGEDSDQMSAAGQMETFLGIQGTKEICAAVKKCWASQFSRTAVEYKRQNGQILNSPMAVVIQEMVNCEAAGVLFTCDPVTNNPSVVVITGNYGLGESVVSGSEDPDTVIIQKLENGGVELKSMMIGMKQHKIVVRESTATAEDETVKEDVPEDKRQECCISKEIALLLGQLSLKIEDYYKSPRDIEWGIMNGVVYIFQSRPVTTGFATTDYEVKHEFDGPLRSEGEYFTICNVGEVMPGTTSPLGIDVIQKYFCLMFNRKELKQKQRTNFLQSKYYATGNLPFYNHMMLNVMDLLLRQEDLDSTDAQAIMYGVFGRILDDPYIKVLEKYKELPPYKLKFCNSFSFLWNLFFSGVGLNKIHKEVFNSHFLIEECETSLDIFNTLVNRCSNASGAFHYHIKCSEMSSLWNMHMLDVLAKAKGGIDIEVYSDFAKLLSSSATPTTDVESVDVPTALEDLSKWISKDIRNKDFKAMSDEEAVEWLENTKSSAGYHFRQFIKRHGHRCLKEFDMRSLPWSLDPKPLVKLLKNLSGSSSENKDRKGECSDMLSDLKVPLSFVSRLKLRFILPNCQRCVREREACKSVLVKALDNIKTVYYLLSKKMVDEGYLPDNDLMYFMTVDEIHDLLQSRNSKLIARANHRRKLLPELEKLLFPEIMKGRPVSINEKEDIEYVADLTMKGIPVSQGTVKGYVRIAMSLEEAAHLQPGEILITYGTDIGWSPYFPILAGVVTELGGLISHGAVISREYGLPCIVGLQAATRHFKTGDYVLLDGNKGIIKRLTPPEEGTSGE